MILLVSAERNNFQFFIGYHHYVEATGSILQLDEFLDVNINFIHYLYLNSYLYSHDNYLHSQIKSSTIIK